MSVSCMSVSDGEEKNLAVFPKKEKRYRCSPDNHDVQVNNNKKKINKPVIAANRPLFFLLGDGQITAI